jgi:DNA-binding transcriptional regulator YiaG
MTNPLYPDCTTTKTGTLPFASGELDRSGLRLTRAEFARFLGVSKQATSEWVTSGKITLGADGRLDPRQAVSQLLRNTDPARLRAKVLEPLSRDIGRLQQRVAELETALVRATEDATFHEESAGELAEQLNALDRHLLEERAALVLLPSDKVIDGIAAWLKRVSEDGLTGARWLSIFECAPGNGLDDLQHELDNLPLGALEENAEGEWGDGMAQTPEELDALGVGLEKMEAAADDD